MKTIVLSIAILLGAGASTANLTPILSGYYQIKDALVAGNPQAAAKAAADMLGSINGADMKTLDPEDRTAFLSLREQLAADARQISESKDIDRQREHFVRLSANLLQLAKKVHLSAQPIYEEYCPMRKAYWLSNDQAIVNPYLGNGMRNCGKVTATIKP
ncbi:MAG TPA: DUF3347 domain-containing protein [Puia sp.]|nr:DUF3347 domain-containing protein [Puia sp.]